MITIKSDVLHRMISLNQDIKKYLPQGVPAQLLLKLKERAEEILKNHQVNITRIDLGENPANSIWFWGQGTPPELKPFKEKFGLDGAIISAVDLVNGIGKIAGLEVISVPGINGYYDTNYKGKADYAIKALDTKNFVFIHIEGPDEAGHNGDIKAKISCIEHIDKEIVGAILNRFDNQEAIRILVVPDHPTPLEKRTHTSDPVGFIMYGKGVSHDESDVYNEGFFKQ